MTLLVSLFRGQGRPSGLTMFAGFPLPVYRGKGAY